MAGFNNNPGAPSDADNFRSDMEVLNQDESGPEGHDEDSERPDTDEEEPETPAEETDETDKDEESEEESEESDEPEDEAPESTPVERGIHARPTVRQITTKYPQFFKDFPDMRHMLFREGEYSKVFPTVEDARSAAENAQNFEQLSELVTSGKPEDFVQFVAEIKEAKGLDSMAANFLPALYKTDRDMYFKVTSPIAESMVQNAYKAAVQAGNESLKNACLHIAQWAFGDTAYATGEKKSPPLTVEKKQDPDLQRERTEFQRQKYDDAQGYVQNNSRTRLTAEISRGLDPNNALTPTMKNLLVKEIMNEIGSTLQADERHMAQMNSMWKQANKAGFAGDWKDRILSTYLSRARQMMPAIRTRIRDGALKTEQRKAKGKEEVAERSSTRREVQGSGQSNGKSNGRPPAASEIDWRKTSDMDILNDRPTLKKR